MHRAPARGKQRGPSTPASPPWIRRPRFAAPAFLATLIAITLALALPAAASADFELTFNIEGNGTGTFECEVDESTPEACESGDEFPAGAELAIYAEPEEGSVFVDFSGPCGPAVCELEMNEDQIVTATFELEEFELRVETEGEGEGFVECQINKGTWELCPESELYPYETEVTLYAENEEGSEFVEWGGDECFGIEVECELTMNEEHEVIAFFEHEEFELTVWTNGEGEGFVECEVESGPLEPCWISEIYPYGTEVRLYAEPEEGSEFVEWTGCDNVVGDECEVEMTEEKTVEAFFKFKAEEFELAVTVSGEGKVDANTGAILNCRESSGVCSDEYVENTEVTLTATPDLGNQFEGWTGCDSEPSGNCKVKMSAAKAVTAEFAPTPPPEEFELEVTVTGEGKVDANSGPISGCRESSGTCSGLYVENTEVTLTATPDLGNQFEGWTGCDSEPSGNCKVKMSAAKAVTAEFAPTPPPEEFELEVTVTGEGKVDANSGPISGCRESSGTCSGLYVENTEVTLTATPDLGNQFEGWTGCDSEPSGNCKVKMSAAKAVTAEFGPTKTLTITKVGTGTVECKDEGAGSFGACASSYGEGHVVKLKETPGGGFSFGGWSEFAGSGSVTTACTGAVAECEVKMDANVSGKATFTANTKTLTITKVGTGTVECKDEGAGSFGACAASYGEGHVVKLKETPGGGFSFGGWSEFAGSGSVTTACTGAVAECEVKMDANVSGKATFTANTKTLTITKVGTGTVECKDEGAGSFGACAASYGEGHVVKLKETPGGGFSFGGWSEFAGSGSVTTACTGAVAECEVKMDANVSGKATFTANTKTLTITKVGTGTVECKDEGAGSFGACAASYGEGHVVKLKETPGGGFSFGGWSEFAGSGSVTTACTGAVAECEVKMDANVSGKATFTANTKTLTITKVGTGTVECKDEGAGSFGACAASYGEGHVVKLKETPGGGFSFGGWSEFAGSGSVTTACTGAVAECEVKMDANVSGKATFTANTKTLTITKVGTGTGSVTCDGGACASTYPEGTAVTLAATAASGSTFAGWSGGGCSGTGTCVVTLNADTTVTATFNKEEVTPPPIEGTAKAAATATVKSGKAALKLTCSGGPCKGSFQLKAKVKQGKKAKTLVIGKGSFSLASGASTTLKVKLSGPAKQELAKGKTIKAKLGGTGIQSSTVKLKPAKKKKK